MGKHEKRTVGSPLGRHLLLVGITFVLTKYGAVQGYTTQGHYHQHRNTHYYYNIIIISVIIIMVVTFKRMLIIYFIILFIIILIIILTLTRFIVLILTSSSVIVLPLIIIRCDHYHIILLKWNPFSVPERGFYFNKLPFQRQKCKC